MGYGVAGVPPDGVSDENLSEGQSAATSRRPHYSDTAAPAYVEADVRPRQLSMSMDKIGFGVLWGPTNPF